MLLSVLRVRKQAFYKRCKARENKQLNDEKIFIMIQGNRKIVG
jgi:hypothetical protein